MAAAVTVYTTGWCPYCHRAKALLRKKNVDFAEIDVDDRPDLRQWLAERSRQRTVPQIFVNGRPLGGFVDVAALDRAGKLDELLAKAPAPSDPELRT